MWPSIESVCCCCCCCLFFLSVTIFREKPRFGIYHYFTTVRALVCCHADTANCAGPLLVGHSWYVLGVHHDQCSWTRFAQACVCLSVHVSVSVFRCFPAVRHTSLSVGNSVAAGVTQVAVVELEIPIQLVPTFQNQVPGNSNNNDSNKAIVLVGATNRPQELDEAARRRFVKR